LKETWTISRAANYLSVSEPGLRKIMLRGELTASAGPRGKEVAADDVRDLHTRRQMAVIGRHPNAVAFAQETHDVLWPEQPAAHLFVNADGSPDAATMARAMAQKRGKDALVYVDPDAVTLFGRSSVTAAALPREKGCRACWASLDASMYDRPGPGRGMAYRKLFGQQPCERDFAEWAVAERLERAAEKAVQAQLGRIEMSRKAQAEAAGKIWRPAVPGESAAQLVTRHQAAMRTAQQRNNPTLAEWHARQIQRVKEQ